MTADLRDSLAQVQELFRETSGNRWAAEGARVVSDPKYKVYKGHIADCVEEDDAAFIAACYQLFRNHGPALLAMMEDHSPDAGKMGEDAGGVIGYVGLITPSQRGAPDDVTIVVHTKIRHLEGLGDKLLSGPVMICAIDAARAGERG